MSTEGSANWDDLLAEAKEALAERQDDDSNAELGDEMTPAPESHFAGRWRSDVGKMVTKERGTIDVFLVWDSDGNRGFLYQHSQLVAEVNAERPKVGDEVLVLRGPTKEFEKDGEMRKTYPYVLRKRESSDPLPEEPATASAQLGGGDDLPFLCLVEQDLRSVRAAAAVTA